MDASNDNSSSAEHSPQRFATTRWTRVLQARGNSPEARTALAELCEAYYQPVHRFIQSEGRKEDAARELTQEFFTRILARRGLDSVEPGKGRFRSFLLGAVKHFLADMRVQARAAKRGGGHVPLSINAESDTNSELPIPDPAAKTSDTWFDREWALTVVNRAVEALATEWQTSGKGETFAMLKPWLMGAIPSLSQAETAQSLGWTEGAVKVAIHRLRKRFRELVKAEIGQTVEDSNKIQDELRYLVDVLAQT